MAWTHYSMYFHDLWSGFVDRITISTFSSSSGVSNPLNIASTIYSHMEFPSLFSQSIAIYSLRTSRLPFHPCRPFLPCRRPLAFPSLPWGFPWQHILPSSRAMLHQTHLSRLFAPPGFTEIIFLKLSVNFYHAFFNLYFKRSSSESQNKL